MIKKYILAPISRAYGLVAYCAARIADSLDRSAVRGIEERFGGNDNPDAKAARESLEQVREKLERENY